MISPKTILVPTDFSDTSEVALNYGRALSETFKSSLHVLHVVSDADLGPGAAELWGFSPRDLLDRWEADARRRLDELCPEADRKTLRMQVVTRVGKPFVEVVHYAREHDVDLIVIGTHGRGAVQHALLGSVAEQVVRNSPCPVLTVRHPEHEFVMP